MSINLQNRIYETLSNALKKELSAIEGSRENNIKIKLSMDHKKIISLVVH